ICMPPGGDPTKEKTLQDVVDEVDLYPIEAFYFVQEGLKFAVTVIHGEKPDTKLSRHISGAQLCEGLREYALSQWGMLARVVLRRWNITSTLDFGKIVFALIDAGHMQKTENDTLDDFRNVYDFKAGFEGEYQIGSKS